MRRRAHIVLLVAVGMLAGLAPAAAADTIYNSQGAFQAAVADLSTVSFAPFYGPGDTPYPGGFTADGVTFSSSDGYLYSRNGGGVSGIYGDPTAGITITLPGWSDAVGGYFAAFYGGTVTVTLADGSSQSATLGEYQSAFFGFVSDSPITSLTVSAAGFPVLRDGLQYATPEPASLLLFGSGLTLLAGLIRRGRGARAKRGG